VVVRGSGRMKVDDEVVELKEWDAVRVPPGTWRGYEAGPKSGGLTGTNCLWLWNASVDLRHSGMWRFVKGRNSRDPNAFGRRLRLAGAAD
jgi:hypothetical protein